MPKNKVPHRHIVVPTVLYVLLGISSLLVVYTAVKIRSILFQQSENYDNHLRYQVANNNFRNGTDILTENVRRYVVTMKQQYLEDYFIEAENDRHRDQAVEMLRELPVDETMKSPILKASEVSRILMDTEYHAMHLLTSGHEDQVNHPEVTGYQLSAAEADLDLAERHALAQNLLWDEKYIEAKNKIYAYLDEGLDNSGRAATLQHQALSRTLLDYMICGMLCLGLMLVAIFGMILNRRYLHEKLLEEQAIETARMNEQLKEERDKSIKAEKAKSYFFSTVSHDIRTPLNAIIGFSEMLQLGIDDPEEKEKALDAIITSGHTLLELINDVLDLSKLEAGKMELHPCPTDVAGLISKVTTSFETATARSSLQLLTDVQKMPFLALDPQRIRQILFNLIGNAVKFTTKGSVTVRATYENGEFALSVTDTGCGISKENMEKLMSPYVRLQIHENTVGTGLGLAICKQLAQQMNGRLEIQSEVGKGSTFTLRVPNVEAFTDQESEAYVCELKHKKPVDLAVAMTEKRILVVDDQKLNQRILCTMMNRLGFHKVLTAGNGREALDVLAEAGNVDIVLTDMSMPVMDGEGLVREIRKSPTLATVPVYVITADVEMQGEYKEKGFDKMLIKPITLDKLKALLVDYAPHVLAPGEGGNAPEKA